MSAARLVVTGAGGQLGHAVAHLAMARGHDVLAASRSDCDVLDAGAIARTLDAHRPDALVNCAGWTDVDGAEANQDAAYAVNAIGPRLLAAACAKRALLLVHISSDYVFAGTQTSPIDEWAPTGPGSVYGASKLAGEREVRALTKRHQIVRTSWLYGGDGPNFALTMLRAANRGSRVRVVADQRGTPTWTGHLAPALLRLIERDAPGTYHVTAAGETTWHGFASEVLRAARVAAPVEPVATHDYPTAAARPAYSVLDNRAWRILGEPPLPDWREGVTAYVGELRGRGALPAQ